MPTSCLRSYISLENEYSRASPSVNGIAVTDADDIKKPQCRHSIWTLLHRVHCKYVISYIYNWPLNVLYYEGNS